MDFDNNSNLQTTRERVLYTLQRHNRCTINEIADIVEINPISVRHHITRLQADGMVESSEERHGVGRPRRVYFLTEAGREHFPTRYLRLTMMLLDQLKESLPQPVVDRLFTQIANGMLDGYLDKLDALSTEQRLDLIKNLLNSEGFSVDWVQEGDFYRIRESNCPYYYISQNHPEVCGVDQTLISKILAVPAEKVQCMLHGDASCTYLVPISAISEKEGSFSV